MRNADTKMPAEELNLVLYRTRRLLGLCYNVVQAGCELPESYLESHPQLIVVPADGKTGELRVCSQTP